MSEPLWVATPRAIRHFNYLDSLPKVCFQSVRVLAGLCKKGHAQRPLALTFSISEDYARVWLYFAQKNLAKEEWDFLIVDSAGDMDPAKFSGASVVRFLNFYHGKKIDIFLRKVLRSERIFLCDDDQYVMDSVTPYLTLLEDPKTPVVSLRPRNWWRFRIQGREYLPMGSYVLFFNKDILLQNDIRFESPADATSKYKVFAPGIKQQLHYDTADYANEQLLLAGYTIETLKDNPSLLGFTGLSAPRLLLKKYGKASVARILTDAKHYKEGSINGSTMRALYAIVKFEQLYQRIFNESPQFVSGLSEEELRGILVKNSNIDSEMRNSVSAYFDRQEELFNKLCSEI